MRKSLPAAVTATIGIAAPEALAIPIAGAQGWGGGLMAAPIVGAAVGIVLIGRRPPSQHLSPPAQIPKMAILADFASLLPAHPI